MPDARRFVVKGRVQGVFFRDSTRRVAVSLGISGHAINLDNGAVEVLASGPESALAELENWLQNGPPLASVESVAAEPADVAVPDGFRIA